MAFILMLVNAASAAGTVVIVVWGLGFRGDYVVSKNYDMLFSPTGTSMIILKSPKALGKSFKSSRTPNYQNYVRSNTPKPQTYEGPTLCH